MLMTHYSLAKQSDIDLILNKLNSYHPDIQFTYEEFIDKNDVHFLDIKLTSALFNNLPKKHSHWKVYTSF